MDWIDGWLANEGRRVCGARIRRIGVRLVLSKCIPSFEGSCGGVVRWEWRVLGDGDYRGGSNRNTIARAMSESLGKEE